MRRALTRYIISQKRIFYAELYEIEKLKLILKERFNSVLLDPEDDLNEESFLLSSRLIATKSRLVWGELFGRRVTQGKVDQCPVCFVENGIPQTIVEHFRQNNIGPVYKCEQCGYEISAGE